MENQHGSDSPNEGKVKFTYISGSLENSVPTNYLIRKKDILKSQGIRQHVCEILEGGEEAFRKREEKYDLQRLPKSRARIAKQ